MMRVIRLRSIRSKLIFAFLTAFTPLAVLHFSAYYQQYQSRKELVLRSHSSLSYSIAKSLNTFVEGIDAAHSSVGKSIEEGESKRTLARRLQGICTSNPGIESSCVLSTDGSVICVNPVEAAPEDVMPGHEITALTSGARVSVSGLSDGTHKRPVFTVTSLVTPEGREPVIVRSVINADRIRQLVPYSVTCDYAVIIVDSNGRTVMDTRELNQTRNWNKCDFIKNALSGQESVIFDFHLNEQNAMFGYVTPVRNIRWAVAVLNSEEECMASIRDAQTRSLILSIFVTLVGMVGIVFLGNRITSPIRRLSRAASALAVGDFRKRIDIHTSDEMKSLADSFNAMAQSLEQHERELTDKTAALEGLFRVAKAVTSSLDMVEILKSLVTVSCEVMDAQACAILLTGDDGILTIRESHNLSEEFKNKLLLNTEQGCIGRAVKEKHWVVCQETEEFVHCSLRDIAGEEGLASALCAPLIAGKTALGVLVVWTSFRTIYDELHIELLCSIAGYASSVIQNAEKYTREYNTAEVLQHGLISSVPAELSGLKFGSRYTPAQEDIRVGGDFYDVVELPDGKVGVVIADVSGKGQKAAVHTAACKYMLRAYAFSKPDAPALAFQELNDALYHFEKGRFFVTAFCAVIDPASWTMTYVNAGHPPSVLINHEGRQQVMLYKTGIPLGFEPGTSYGQRTVVIEPGSGVFLYTDGLTEAKGSEGMLDIEGLQDMLFEAVKLEPQPMVDWICERVHKYAEGLRRDDVAVVAFFRAPAEEILVKDPSDTDDYVEGISRSDASRA